MEQSPTLIELLISLLQSVVVLLLASGVYVAFAVRKADESQAATDAKPAASHRGPTRVI